MSPSNIDDGSFDIIRQIVLSWTLALCIAHPLRCGSLVNALSSRGDKYNMHPKVMTGSTVFNNDAYPPNVVQE